MHNNAINYYNMLLCLFGININYTLQQKYTCCDKILKIG